MLSHKPSMLLIHDTAPKLDNWYGGHSQKGILPSMDPCVSVIRTVSFGVCFFLFVFFFLFYFALFQNIPW